MGSAYVPAEYLSQLGQCHQNSLNMNSGKWRNLGKYNQHLPIYLDPTTGVLGWKVTVFFYEGFPNSLARTAWCAARSILECWHRFFYAAFNIISLWWSPEVSWECWVETLEHLLLMFWVQFILDKLSSGKSAKQIKTFTVIYLNNQSTVFT